MDSTRLGDKSTWCQRTCTDYSRCQGGCPIVRQFVLGCLVRFYKTPCVEECATELSQLKIQHILIRLFRVKRTFEAKVNLHSSSWVHFLQQQSYRGLRSIGEWMYC